MINKQHWDTVITCKIHEGSGMNIGYDAAKQDKNACDHELITITLEVPGSDIPLQIVIIILGKKKRGNNSWYQNSKTKK